ncbi:MAG: hypothetical protein ISS78_08460, partial [Phycisphaerae bacterium]|nr:hypothetical protein [Phycisphaerae bacterium]
MRTEITERFYRTYTYQGVDRVPDVEFGYWPQTIRRWLAEGMPLELTPEETNNMFSRKIDEFFGFEHEGTGLPISVGMNPPFEEEIIERKASSVVMRTPDGIVAERFLNDSDNSSIPHFLKFPVETPDDWQAMKQRYRADDPVRAISDERLAEVRTAQGDGKMISVFICGFYGQLRHWMGMENLSYAFYDMPDMIHDMVETWTDLVLAQLDGVGDDIPIDMVSWWEDMAGRNGPLVSPAVFREFLQPGYHRVMTAAKKRGCAISIVDCDGNPHDIVANWLEEGVNIMFPLEVAAGVDPYAWREEFGMDLRLRGGIRKSLVTLGAE